MRRKIFLATSLLILAAWTSQANEARAAPINLRDYGAVGDGVTDDGPALQRALDALAEAGGGTLFVPEGRYAIITPVSEDFTGRASSITIMGVESFTLVDNSGEGESLAQGLDLLSEFAPKSGETQIAVRIAGLQNFLLKDICFIGTADVFTDALITLAIDEVEDATIRHCEFYAVSSQTEGGAIVQASRSRLTIDQSKFLGCTGDSGTYLPVVQNLVWKNIVVTDSTFLDYGNRPELYGKTGMGAPISWINIGNAEAISSDSPRREVVIRNVFLDEGGLCGIYDIPYRYDPPSAPIDLVYITGLRMNVSNLGWPGNSFADTRAVLIEKSRYEWSQNSDSAISLNAVGTAILDRVECLDSADRIRADASTERLSVINSVYRTLDSQAQITDVINTETSAEDPVQYVRQQYQAVLERAPDAAGHFYWSNLILRCGQDAQCLTDARATLNIYLGRHPAPSFSIIGRTTDENGNPLPDVTVTLSGSQAVATQTAPDGRYRFFGLPTSGNYTVTASKPNCTFIKPSLSFTNPEGDQTADFSRALNKYQIAGRAIDSNNNGIPGITITLTGAQNATAATDDDGNFALQGLTAFEDYMVTPSLKHYTFEPRSRSFDDLAGDQSAAFAGTLNTHTISGRVNKPDGSAIAGANVSLSGGQAGTTATDSAGNYSFAHLPAGADYTVALSKTNYSFATASQTMNDLGANQAADFTGELRNYEISGRVAVNGTPLSGVALTLSGSQSASTTTGTDGGASFTVPAEGTYTLMPSKVNYTFDPASVVVTNLSADSAGDFTARLNPGVPVLVTEVSSIRALALDSVLRTREPFQPSYTYPWVTDRRTRIMLFATNLDLSPNDNAADFSADAEDEAHRIYPLAVEYAGRVSGLDWLSCIVVSLSDDLGDAGDVLIRVTYRGVSGGRVRVAIGHIGGGPPDDDSVPTPGRAP